MTMSNSQASDVTVTDLPEGVSIATPTEKPDKPEQPPAANRAGKPTDRARGGKKSKKDQLIALIAKADGARISMLVERLGWQAHTVRAALSGLRKEGHQILASKSPRTGEAVYRLITPLVTQVTTAPEEAAS